MKITRMTAILGVLAFSGVVSAGCGVSNHVATAHHTAKALARTTPHHSSQSRYTLLKTDGISIRVPQGWHLGHQITVLKTAATGLNAGSLVPQVPKDTAALTHDSRNQSPYFTETMEPAGHSAYGAIYELSASGNYYNIHFQVPQSSMDALRKALQTVTLPPVATVTQAVHLIEHRATIGINLWLANASAANTHWMLLGGAVATAQQPFYLFRTSDGGNHWSLINYTSTPQHIFPDVAGRPSMLFWSADDGIMAEVTGWSHDVWIYSTRNGGQTWTLQKVSLPSQPNSQKPPRPQIAWKTNGTLTISGMLSSGVPYHLTSHNSGRTWTA